MNSCFILIQLNIHTTKMCATSIAIKNQNFMCTVVYLAIIALSFSHKLAA